MDTCMSAGSAASRAPWRCANLSGCHLGARDEGSRIEGWASVLKREASRRPQREPQKRERAACYIMTSGRVARDGS